MHACVVHGSAACVEAAMEDVTSTVSLNCNMACEEKKNPHLYAVLLPPGLLITSTSYSTALFLNPFTQATILKPPPLFFLVSLLALTWSYDWDKRGKLGQFRLTPHEDVSRIASPHLTTTHTHTRLFPRLLNPSTSTQLRGHMVVPLTFPPPPLGEQALEISVLLGRFPLNKSVCKRLNIITSHTEM